MLEMLLELRECIVRIKQKKGHAVRRPHPKTIVALTLAAALGLGACGNAAIQEQTQTDAQAEQQTQVEDKDGAQATDETAATTDESAATVAPSVESQTIGLEGVGNARQLGGYVGEGGRTVKDGVLLRTAALGEATEGDIARLGEVYHLAEVIDLRMDREVGPAPDPEIEGVKNLHLSIMDERAMLQKVQEADPEDAEKLNSGNQVDKLRIYIKLGVLGDQMYVNFLSADQGKEGYAKMFQELLALPEGQSLLFHCTQGKDRTGCAAMLILSVLGVDEDTILADYMLTNEFNADLIAGERQKLIDSGVKEDELDSIMIAMDQVYPQMMTNALDWMKDTYGSVKGYVTQELGVTEDQIVQLQDKFLA
jgi:protein-tyrosine phosphatase